MGAQVEPGVDADATGESRGIHHREGIWKPEKSEPGRTDRPTEKPGRVDHNARDPVDSGEPGIRERVMGIEPTTSGLGSQHSTAELHPQSSLATTLSRLPARGARFKQEPPAATESR